MTLEDLSDFELDELGEALYLERRHRLLLQYDPKTIADEAFRQFDSRGNGPDPTMVGGLVVCWGSLRGRPQGHRCSFVSIDGESWCWDYDHEHDEMRWESDEQLYTVTVLVARPRMLLTQVESVSGNAGHQRKATSSWTVKAGALEPCATPSRVPDDHRR